MWWLSLIAAALLAAFTLLEHLAPASRAPTDRLFNMKAWVWLLLVQYGPAPLVVAVTAWLRHYYGLVVFDLSTWPLWAGLLAFVVVMDFGEFIFHVAEHRVGWLWKIHALHHSDPAVNATTSVRHACIEPILKALTIWPAAAILFSPTPTIFAIYALLSLHNIYAHVNLPINYGRWSWVAMSPAYHRLHHSTDPEDFNVNFGQFFPLFDVLFGTYKRPLKVAETGLDHRPSTFLDAPFWPMRTRS